MKTYSILCVLAVWTLTTTVSYGQNNALRPGSAEAERALREYELGRGHTREEATKQQKKTGASKKNRRATVYDDFKEPYRTQFIEEWERAIKSTKQNIKNTKRALARASSAARYNQAAKEAKQRFKKNLEQAKQRLKELEMNDPPFVQIPLLPREPRDWRIGSYGDLGRNAKIIQIINEDTMLIEVDGMERNSKRRLVMLSGFSTKRWTDGSVWGISKPVVKITGTTTYTTVNGSTKTVLKIVKATPSDRDAYLKSLKRKKP